MKSALIIALLSISPLAAQTPAPAKPSTLTAVTQDRDKAIYDWAKRHEEVLALGKNGPVDVVMLGDSILHYWAGEPKAPIIRSEASWKALFDGKTSANLGFGWDRVENVLWRVNNRELAELKPKTVVLLIGTNNLEFNTAAETEWASRPCAPPSTNNCRNAPSMCSASFPQHQCQNQNTARCRQ